MPRAVGKWWGQVKAEDQWTETEIDLAAYDDHHLILGECKYREKAVGLQELNRLMFKAQFVALKKRELYYLLASRSGFTQELLSLRDPRVILIDQC